MRLLPGWKRKGDKQVKIPWSTDNARLVREAKTAIQNAEYRKALDILAGLQNPQLDEQITLLNNQLARYRRENIQGTQAFEEKNVTFNRISARILSLINTIEEGLAFEEQEYREVKDYLRQRYQNRLDQKLAGRQPVNLRRLPSTEGTSQETSAIFKSFGVDEIRDEITKVFHDTHGRLLIIGKPGAGKTVLMLQLVIRLLDTEKDVLPVVLNLASWQSSFGRLENWLEKIIPSELGVNTNFAKKITEQYRLILLLDGFDEVKEEERVSCLEAIGKYGADAGRQFVIASRINEYKAVAQDAPVYGQIEVGPLTIRQIESELERVGYDQPEALRLLHAIRQDGLLRETVQTPFYFNTMQLMFAEGKRWSDFGFLAGTLAGRQREIMERFIESGLVGQGDNKFSSKQAKNWLSYFSYQMNGHNLVVFELRDLQYDWWRWTRRQIAFAGLVDGLAYGLTLGLVTSLVYCLILGLLGSMVGNLFHILVKSLSYGLVFCLAFSLAGGLLGSLFTKKTPLIYTNDNARWSMNVLIINIKKIGFFGLVLGIIVFLNFGLIGGIVGSLIGGLSFGLVNTITDRGNYSYFLQINTTYQRFTASMKALHFSILQHLLLRYQLYRQGLLPLRLVDFLNEMSERHLMETDGATWRFRHRLIQDYFAEGWDESIEKGEPDTSKADATRTTINPTRKMPRSKPTANPGNNKIIEVDVIATPQNRRYSPGAGENQ